MTDRGPTCWCTHGHRVFTDDGVHVECDECGCVFYDPNNTNRLPTHDAS